MINLPIFSDVNSAERVASPLSRMMISLAMEASISCIQCGFPTKFSRIRCSCSQKLNPELEDVDERENILIATSLESSTQNAEYIFAEAPRPISHKRQ